MGHLKKALQSAEIKLIVYDFDGVLTDNKVIVDENGKESVVVNRSDGLAIGMIKERGIQQLILSKETNPVVVQRAKKLDLPVLNSIDDKKKALSIYCQDNTISLENVIYIGNDLNDIEVMQSVGYSLCPSDAYRQVKDIAQITLETKGGDGVVRELVEYLFAKEFAV